MTLRFGRYETIQPLASGGMAQVYLGRAVGAGGFERRVAIKVMHEHIAEDPEFVAMFLDEARLAARIHHPNVVGTIDVQKGDEGMFLVMEYIEGASLRRVLRANKKLNTRIPFPVTVRVMCDALNGLQAAHDLTGRDGALLNLVHRDVSPHNILVGTDGVSRITDFGVARAEARLSTTRGGQLKGKIAYMPPEQGMGEEVDRRADVYAAGVCLWEMLTGRRLFKAEHDGQLVAMILQGASQSPCEVVPDVPVHLNDVCMRALALSPGDRYATAAEFAEALESAMFEMGERMANTRQVAAFIEAFKVRITAVSPETITDEDSQSISASASSPMRPDIATMPEPRASEPSAVTKPGSVTGVATQRAVDIAPAPASKAGWLVAVALAVALGAVLVIGIAGDSQAPTDGTANGQQVDDLSEGGTAEDAQAKVSASPSAVPVASASAVASTAASATHSVSPSEAKQVPRPRAQQPVRPRPAPVAKPTNPRKKGPLDFEAEGL